MTKLLSTRVQHLILPVSGQKPTVPGANTMPDSPTWRWSDIMEGEFAWNRPDNIWYYRDGGTIEVLGSTPPEVITPELTAAYDPEKPNDPGTGFAYISGSDFVTYINGSSPDPEFQILQIYLCIESAYTGESPETHPEKWEPKGNSVEIHSNSLSQIFFANELEIKAITGYIKGSNIVNLANGAILKYDSEATSGIQPNDNAGSTGRWVKVGQMLREITIDNVTGLRTELDELNVSTQNGLVKTDGKIGLGGQMNNNVEILLNSNSIVFSEDMRMFIPPNLDSSIFKMVFIPDTFQFVIGGFFSGHLKRLNEDGSEDITYSLPPTTGFQVNAIVAQPDGKIIVAGAIGVSFSVFLKRFNQDGSEDLTFTMPSSINGQIQTLALQEDGKVLVGGNFNGFLKRLNQDGTEDITFTPASIVRYVSSVALQTDGKILAKGGIGLVKRLDSTGIEDSSFTTIDLSPYEISLITLQPDGKILVAFGVLNGITMLKRFNSDGSEDLTFTQLTVERGFQDIVLQDDGKILLGLSSDGFLKRINSDGSEDMTFTPPSTIRNTVSQIIFIEGFILVATSSTIKLLHEDGSEDTEVKTRFADGLLEHAEQYHRYYSDRTLVDKEYVDNLLKNDYYTRKEGPNNIVVRRNRPVIIQGALLNTDSLTISLEEPVTGYKNEYAVHLWTGNSIPEISHPTNTYHEGGRSSIDVYTNMKLEIVYKQVEVEPDRWEIRCAVTYYSIPPLE